MTQHCVYRQMSTIDVAEHEKTENKITSDIQG